MKRSDQLREKKYVTRYKKCGYKETRERAQLAWIARYCGGGFALLLFLVYFLPPPSPSFWLRILDGWGIFCLIGFFHATYLIWRYNEEQSTKEPDEKQDKS